MNQFKGHMLGILICSLFLFGANKSVSASDKIAFKTTEERPSQAFNSTIFNQLKKKYQGSKWLMILWSVDCPACFKELALIQSFNDPTLKIIIINTDDNNEVITERNTIEKQYHLMQYARFHFSDGTGDKMRYLIDPSWYGELPRSYFIDKQGKFYGKSGLIKAELIKKWLAIH